ncbi:MAG: histidine phosphatase family protein [Fuerstiella sp.]
MNSSKLLFLVRHAKSSWKDETLDDLDRPLNGRGRRNAPEMGRRLFVRGQLPAAVISSPATRAVATALALVEAMGVEPGNLMVEESLYGASPDDVLEFVRTLDSTLPSAMLVFHNPCITEVANLFSPEPIDNVPTCGIVTLQIDADHWTFVRDSVRLIDFDYPKNSGRNSSPDDAVST